MADTDTFVEALQSPLLEAGDLSALVWKKEELTRRLTLLLETRALAALQKHVPHAVEVDPGTYERMAKFILRVRSSVQSLCKKMNEAMKTVQPDRSDAPDVVRRHVVEFQDEVRKDVAATTVEKGNQVLEAISAAEVALTQTFTFEDLGEDAILMLMESLTGDARLATDAFVIAQEKPKPKVLISFEAPTTNLWSIAVQKREEERAAVPAFRWSWTDDELFGEKKLPKTFRFTHSFEEIEQMWDETVEALRSGFKEWKQQCSNRVSPWQTFQKSTGGKFSREEAFQNIEQRFMKQVSELRTMVMKEFSPDNPIWRGTLQSVQSGVISNLETHCQIQDGTDPVFISDVLNSFYAKASEAEAVQHPLLKNEHIDHASPKYQWMFQTRYLNESVTPSTSILSKVTGLGRELESSKLHTNLIAKIAQVSGETFTGNLRHAFHTAAKALEKELEKALTDNLPNNHTEHSRSEHIQLWKQVIAQSFATISAFQHADLTESQIMQIRNAASFIVAWQARDAVFRVGLMDDWESDETDREAANNELNNFYPAPPEEKNDAVQPHVTMSDVGEWLEQVRNAALQQTDIACTNIAGADGDRCKEHIAQVIRGELQKVSLTGFPHRGKDTIASGAELVALAAHLMNGASRLQKSISVKNDSYALPEGLPIFLQTQISMMTEALCKQNGWSEEADNDAEKTEKKTDAIQKREKEVTGPSTITFTPHEKLLANISPFSMRWLAKKSPTIERLAFDVFHPLSGAELIHLLEAALQRWSDVEINRIEQWEDDIRTERKSMDTVEPTQAHGIALQFKRLLKMLMPHLHREFSSMILCFIHELNGKELFAAKFFNDGLRNEIYRLIFDFVGLKDRWMKIPYQCIQAAQKTLETEIDTMHQQALALARIPQEERPEAKKKQQKKNDSVSGKASPTEGSQSAEKKSTETPMATVAKSSEPDINGTEAHPENEEETTDDPTGGEPNIIADLMGVYEVETPHIAEALSLATADHLGRIATRVLMEHGSQLPREELERVAEELRTRIGDAAAQVREACGQHEGQSPDRQEIAQSILQSFDAALGKTTLPTMIEESMRALTEETMATIADASDDETFIEHIMEGATNGASELDETVEMLRSALETQKLQTLNQTIEKLHTTSARHIDQLSSLSETLIERARRTTTEQERASALEEAERLQTFIGTLLQMYQMQGSETAHDDHQDSSS